MRRDATEHPGQELQAWAQVGGAGGYNSGWRYISTRGRYKWGGTAGLLCRVCMWARSTNALPPLAHKFPHTPLVQGVGVWSGPRALGHGAVLRPRHPPLLVGRSAVPLTGQGGGVQEGEVGVGGERERGGAWGEG